MSFWKYICLFVFNFLFVSLSASHWTVRWMCTFAFIRVCMFVFRKLGCLFVFIFLFVSLSASFWTGICSSAFLRVCVFRKLSCLFVFNFLFVSSSASHWTVRWMCISAFLRVYMFVFLELCCLFVSNLLFVTLYTAVLWTVCLCSRSGHQPW